jgi:molybdopterin/thiamine biosynthesis adenylyltransferase
VSVPDPTLRFRRQLDLLPLDKLDAPITVIGAGAVGSFTALTLAKMGFTNLTVYDDDIVSEHNLPNQFFRLEDLGRRKVEALADLVRSFEGVEIRAVARRFGGEHLRGIVVSAVDSMASRQAIWHAVRFDPAVELFLDGRMGGLVSLVHVVHPIRAREVNAYETSLHDDSEAVQEPCSARSILFTVLGISSTIARLVRLHLVDGEMPERVTQDHAIGLQLTN